MVDLENTTELYDLFGETGTCTICQEDLAEGERVRTIQTCQHTFHSLCVDPWLTQKGTCPLCRIELNRAAGREIQHSVRSVYDTLQNTLQVFSRNGIQTNSIETILSEIQALLEPATAPVAAPPPAPVARPPLERVTLSYCLSNGIWRKYRCATHYNPQRVAIHTGLNTFELGGLRPMPISTISFSAISQACDHFRDEFLQQTGFTTRNYTSAPQIRAMKERLADAAAAGNAFLATHWRG